MNPLTETDQWQIRLKTIEENLRNSPHIQPLQESDIFEIVDIMRQIYQELDNPQLWKEARIESDKIERQKRENQKEDKKKQTQNKKPEIDFRSMNLTDLLEVKRITETAIKAKLKAHFEKKATQAGFESLDDVLM